jgi:hypothetical protein
VYRSSRRETLDICVPRSEEFLLSDPCVIEPPSGPRKEPMETSPQGAVGADFEKAVGLILSPVLIAAWMAVVTEDRRKPLEMDTVGHSGKASRHGAGKLHDCPRDVKRSKVHAGSISNKIGEGFGDGTRYEDMMGNNSVEIIIEIL